MNEIVKTSLYVVFLIAHIAVSITHLVFSYKENKIGEYITRPFLYLTLGLAIYFLASEYPLVYSACFVFAAGDIVILFKKYTPCYLVSIGLLLVGHILNLTSISSLLSFVVPWWIYFILYICALVISCTISIISKNPSNFILSFFLLACLINVIFIFVMISDYLFLYATLLYVGYLIYMLSIYLASYFSKRNNERGKFYTMSAYIVGQSMILLSLTYALINILS